MYWISFLRETGCDLTNSNDGGVGSFNPSLETIEKRRQANFNRSAESRKRTSVAMTGRKHTKDSRNKQSKTVRKLTDKQIEQLKYDRFIDNISTRNLAIKYGVTENPIIAYLRDRTRINIGFRTMEEAKKNYLENLQWQ